MRWRYPIHMFVLPISLGESLKSLLINLRVRYDDGNNQLINAQSASLRSWVAAESTLQQPMQPARDPPLFLCGVLNVYIYCGLE